jgi:hypothetical protein
MAMYDFFYSRLLSASVRKKSEVVIISIAIISFILHLLIIVLVNLKVPGMQDYTGIFVHPIAAIYTPFSFILIYEVYLLVYYLPRSTTIYIGKQYEIIMLILIRRIFKDLANLEFTDNWFHVKNDIQFTYDLAATLLLFFMIFIFYRLNDRKCDEQQKNKQFSAEMVKFIKMKNILAMCLIPTFLVLAIHGLISWIHGSFFSLTQMVDSIRDINSIFFNDFFTILILTDVLILLISFLYTDKFSTVIRNSGFIISTILIKLSFATGGLLNTILIVVAVFFGVAILWIHNQYDKIAVPEK